MYARFKLTPDGDIHIDNGSDSYLDTLSNALADIQAAGISVTPPDLQSMSGIITVVGFEVSSNKKELILDNGWHYPIPESAYSNYQSYVFCIEALPEIIAAKTRRLTPVPTTKE